MSRLTQIQVRYQLPAIFFYGQYDLYKRWLACMRITMGPMVAMFISTILQVPLCMFFMIYLDMGIIGLAIATSIKDFITWCLVTVHGSCSEEISKALVPIDMDSFRGWTQYLKVALPSTLMITAEWWAFQALLILAGIIGVNELAAATICMSLCRLVLMVPLGI